ncbi:MAG: amidohydrolase family protein [Acidobacteriota bacterium]
MKPFRFAVLFACAAGAVPAGCAPGGDAARPGRHGAPASAPTLIVGAAVVDGTGSPGRISSVRLAGDRITGVGELQPTPEDRVLEAPGLVLAPGFIDTHSHAEQAIFDHPDALAAVSQGITTVIVGQDGESPYPLADFLSRLEASPAAVNLAAYAGHGTLRGEVLGEDFRRPATEEEIGAMRHLLGGELEAGALGLSTGLEYDPGIYADRDELIALARRAAAAGGRYVSHVRSEDRGFWAAVDEILEIGSAAGIPVHISHLKLAMRSSWGKAEELLSRLDGARAAGLEVTADIYPYTYWQSTLTVLFPDRDFDDPRAAEFVLREIATPEGLLLSRFDPRPSQVGKTVAEIARGRGVDPATALMDLIREAEQMRGRTGEHAESVIGTSMDERDVERLMIWPFADFCTDGELEGRHPRGFGTYPRILGRYVRERRALTLEEAIRKMTGLAARNVGITGRGVIRPGAFADLVLFDPRTILDRATPERPRAMSIGIEHVWVNGEIVFAAGRATGNRPGRVIRRRGTVDGSTRRQRDRS